MADDLGDEWWLRDEDRSIESKKLATKRERKHDNFHQSSDAGSQVKKRKAVRQQSLTEKPLYHQIDAKTELISALHDYLVKESSTLEEKNYQLDNFNVVDAHLEPNRFVESINEKLVDFVKTVNKSSKRSGRPRVLVIAASAIRALELIRNFQTFSEDFKIAKLFAKHMKVNEQQQFLSGHVIKIAVGTPKRICELLDLEALSLNRLRYIMLDWYWSDVKMRRSFDIPEIKSDITQLLMKHFLDRIQKCKVQLVLM